MTGTFATLGELLAEFRLERRRAMDGRKLQLFLDFDREGGQRARDVRDCTAPDVAGAAIVVHRESVALPAGERWCCLCGETGADVGNA
jgi:hypothetical protein